MKLFVAFKIDGAEKRNPAEQINILLYVVSIPPALSILGFDGNNLYSKFCGKFGQNRSRKS